MSAASQLQVSARRNASRFKMTGLLRKPFQHEGTECTRAVLDLPLPSCSRGAVFKTSPIAVATVASKNAEEDKQPKEEVESMIREQADIAP